MESRRQTLLVGLVAVALAAVSICGVTAYRAAAWPEAALSATPTPGPTPPAPGGEPGQAYTIEQAISDRAQENTIAFDALGFLTGTRAPTPSSRPARWPTSGASSTCATTTPARWATTRDFLTSASLNMLNVLSADQRAQLIALASARWAPSRSTAIQALRADAGLPAAAGGRSAAARPV